MSSSYYPLNGKDEFSRKLLDILKKVKTKNEQIARCARRGDDGQFDNSFYDGQGVASVRTGLGLIADEFGIGKELLDFEPDIDYY